MSAGSPNPSRKRKSQEKSSTESSSRVRLKQFLQVPADLRQTIIEKDLSRAEILTFLHVLELTSGRGSAKARLSNGDNARRNGISARASVLARNKLRDAGLITVEIEPDCQTTKMPSLVGPRFDFVSIGTPSEPTPEPPRTTEADCSSSEVTTEPECTRSSELGCSRTTELECTERLLEVSKIEERSKRASSEGENSTEQRSEDCSPLADSPSVEKQKPFTPETEQHRAIRDVLTTHAITVRDSEHIEEIRQLLEQKKLSIQNLDTGLGQRQKKQPIERTTTVIECLKNDEVPVWIKRAGMGMSAVDRLREKYQSLEPTCSKCRDTGWVEGPNSVIADFPCECDTGRENARKYRGVYFGKRKAGACEQCRGGLLWKQGEESRGFTCAGCMPVPGFTTEAIREKAVELGVSVPIPYEDRYCIPCQSEGIIWKNRHTEQSTADFCRCGHGDYIRLTKGDGYPEELAEPERKTSRIQRQWDEDRKNRLRGTAGARL